MFVVSVGGGVGWGWGGGRPHVEAMSMALPGAHTLTGILYYYFGLTTISFESGGILLVVSMEPKQCLSLFQEIKACKE